MSKFERHLGDDFVQALNKLFDEDGWWSKLVTDPDIFMGIRNNYMNAYYRGCSLATIAWDGKEVQASTHYKYLLLPRVKSPYVKAIDGKFPASWHQGGAPVFIESLSQTEDLKDAAKNFAGGEKTFVAAIIKSAGNPNVFDVEIALTSAAEDAAEEDQTASAQRIDLSALVPKEADRLELVMFEAKLFNNPELRASQDRDAPIIGQINGYQTLLAEHGPHICESAVAAAKNIRDLKGMPEVRKGWAEKLLDAASGDRFSVNVLPTLVVGGFDKDQKSGPTWTGHLAKLEKGLGKERILAAGKGADIRLLPTASRLSR